MVSTTHHLEPSAAADKGEVVMRKIFTLAFLMFAASVLSGCGALMAQGAVESRPGDYHVNGYTHDTNGAVAVASRSYVDQYNAETYRRAVESGRAYAYPGGMGGDYWYHYRGYVPAAPVVAPPPPAVVPPVGPTSSATVAPTGDALAEAREARRRADDALRMHARLRAERMRAADAGTPTP